ncbi:MAG: MFS transporter [Candidatus Marsarchaeota archaeon]|jgi:EmrB/QacA subfamily drug resistance transporter|nr:MFS transporter [Candidatus Marsarchaeota archaeon]MCL5418404.1 MFS transporter [Candidatus Marsarchaeota archaeon]
MQYKWTVLTNTTLGVIMSSLNMNVVMISLPAIFRGLGINPFVPGEFTYLLWVLMGYSIVLATILVTFGRISDIFGRARLYTWGFIIFTAASVLLSIIPDNTGNFGALLLILFRLVQAIGGGFLMVNSTALLTDAFPPNERGKALGLNQVALIVGTLLGLIVGGILASYDWHLIFIMSVPFALAGAVWSIYRLDRHHEKKEVHMDYMGNITIAIGLILVSLGFTYVLMPYKNSQLGWANPWVIGSFAAGILFIVLFAFAEKRAANPLFNLSFFRIRPFTFGNLSLLLSSLARGASMFLVAIWLQGIYLPLHGIPYTETPLWAGIYMLAMMFGMVTMGPISGWLTDKYGARIFATSGMLVIALSLFALTLLPYNFNPIAFELILFFNGIGNGLFASPNTTSIMNSLPPKDRGTGNGMRMTLSNIGSSISMAIFFSVAITVFTIYVPGAMYSSAVQQGIPTEAAHLLAQIPASGLLFGAFLGVDPLAALPKSLTSSLPGAAINVLESHTFLPNVLGPSFMQGLRTSLYISVVLIGIGAVLSALRGKRYVYEEHNGIEK